MNNTITSDEYTYKISVVENVQMPTKAKINEKVVINYNYLLFDGCGSFSHINKKSYLNTIEISVYGKYKYGDGWACTDDVRSIPSTYTFIPSFKGIYIFKFETYNNRFVADSLIVE